MMIWEHHLWLFQNTVVHWRAASVPAYYNKAIISDFKPEQRRYLVFIVSYIN